MQLKLEHFKIGENDTQEFYYFRNDVTSDLVQIIRNKKGTRWFGQYMNEKTTECRPIPAYERDNPEKLLVEVCEWYNSGKLEAMPNEVDVPENTKISKTLMEIESMFGTFPTKTAKRIQAFMDDPTVERWNDISGIIIDGSNSLWQCLMHIDPNFPKSGRKTDFKGRVIAEWTKVPTPLEVLRSIKSGLENK